MAPKSAATCQRISSDTPLAQSVCRRRRQVSSLKAQVGLLNSQHAGLPPYKSHALVHRLPLLLTATADCYHAMPQAPIPRAATFVHKALSVPSTKYYKLTFEQQSFSACAAGKRPNDAAPDANEHTNDDHAGCQCTIS